MNRITLIVTLLSALALTAGACSDSSPGTPATTADTAVTDDTAAPSDDTTAPSDDTAAPSDDTTTTSKDIEEPGPEDVEPAIEDVEPAVEDVEPAVEDVEPAVEDVEPAVEDVEPAVEDVEPAPEDVEPTTEDVEPTPEEDVAAGPEDTTPDTPAGCTTVAELTASEEGPVEMTLCDLAVTVVYYNGYYVQEAGGDATNIYVGMQMTDEGEWPYAAPSVGDILTIPVTEFGSFNGHQEVLASGAPTVTGTTTLDEYYLDLSSGTLPSEELESRLVMATGVTIDEVDGDTLKVSYGTATDVQVYLSGTIQVCEGATMTIATGVITEYSGVHQVKVFEAATNITDLDMTGCLDETYNWDFEDWSDSDPPVNFVKTKENDGFSVTQETTHVHGGTSAALVTVITKDNPELGQIWYMDIPEGTTSTTFSLWLMDNDPNLKGRLVFKFFDGNQEVGDGEKYSDYTEDSADWAQLSVTREVPAEATQVRAYVRFYDAADFEAAGTASIVIDDWNITF